MRPQPIALAFLRRLLQALTVLNALYGFGILLLLVASVVAERAVFGALGFDIVGPDGMRDTAFVMGLRTIAVLGIVAAGVFHLVLTGLLAIVGTVQDGDPFIAQNAGRLNRMAWAVLAQEVLRLLVWLAATLTATRYQRLDIDMGGAFGGWVIVLVLFVLARVFAEGARMREELEGTV